MDGRRRLLSYIARLLSKDEAREFIANVRMVIDVPADLEARVIAAFHDVSDAVETNDTRRAEAAAADATFAEAMKVDVLPSISNPYAKRSKPPPPTPYEKLLGSSTKHNASISNKSTGAGRRKGSKN